MRLGLIGERLSVVLECLHPQIEGAVGIHELEAKLGQHVGEQLTVLTICLDIGGQVDAILDNLLEQNRSAK